MRRRLTTAAAGLSFVILLVLLIWQGSFKITYAPSDPSETILLWSVSTIIFLLTVLLAFMLFRAGVKVYIDRHRNKEGSRIRSKMLFGALVLSLAPAFFCVVFSVYVLNRHLDTWFSQTALEKLDTLYRKEAQDRVNAETLWISLLPEVHAAAVKGVVDDKFFRTISRQHGIRQLVLHRPGKIPLLLHQTFQKSGSPILYSNATVSGKAGALGSISVAADLDGDLDTTEGAFAKEAARQRELQTGRRKFYQETYFRLICLITLFVLFLAAWSAQILSRQIAIPVSALLGAAREIRRGNLSYRVRVNAIDELATLVRAFNEMADELDSNARELEARRRFTEAILESIPTGVLSVTSDERIEHVNRALAGIFPAQRTIPAKLLEDVFSGDDLAEIRYLLKRARRTGAAAGQLDIQGPNTVLHLAVTIASLSEQRGFVLVIEDTSDLLRAQKAAAWQEVARRIAHEIKNPLTPISLSSERIARQIPRLNLDARSRAILEECTQIIGQEVGTVKSLVDEFSQFSRFPAAHPTASELNEIVESALAVFAGRLESISLSMDLANGLPLVVADREQMKRVIVNLIDNAAEAMLDSPVRQIFVRTAQTSAETIELTITDTGCGISALDKEKLFLPYFSTKGRGTGLGLAIVSHIVQEHGGHVRVDDNHPSGVRFTVELNTILSAEPQLAFHGPATLEV